VSLGVVIASLAIPADARVDQRVPKKLLLEQGAPTAADKRQIQDGIEEMFWIAALKPTNVGVPAYQDDCREYLEIAIINVLFRVNAQAGRIIELIHRAVPYPVVLVAEHDGGVSLSLAHKRWSQGEAGKMVVEEVRQTDVLCLADGATQESSFLASLALSSLPTQNMFVLYQGWLDCVAARQAASITGRFCAPSATRTESASWEDLDMHARLQREIASLRAQAERENQISRRVTLNLEIKKLEAEVVKVERNLLSGGSA
jgi:hypothetical protein